MAAIREFLKLEAAAGVILVAAAVLALIAANSPLSGLYTSFLDLRLALTVGSAGIEKPVLLWINDGLMAIFFLLVGLEIKRELLEGELSSVSKAALPFIAAVGGMIVPALLYTAINWQSTEMLRGWAIPTATDIAFAVGVVVLLGTRVAPTAKVFLLALAIIDDLGAIIVIAVFYTEKLSATALVMSACAIAVLITLNRTGVRRVAAYVITGIVLWVCVLKSGVHATLAGVAVAFSIPLSGHRTTEESPVARVEHALHPWVSYGVLPLFAFANAGVSLAGVSWQSVTNTLPLGIAAGLFLGKQAGVMLAVWIATRLRIAALPKGVSWTQMYGVALLTGIGFTMSLFIGTLAFDDSRYATSIRIGVLLGSILSAVSGYAVLRLLPIFLPPSR